MGCFSYLAIVEKALSGLEEMLAAFNVSQELSVLSAATDAAAMATDLMKLFLKGRRILCCLGISVTSHSKIVWYLLWASLILQIPLLYWRVQVTSGSCPRF